MNTTLARRSVLKLADYKDEDSIFVFNRSGNPDSAGKNTRDSGPIIFTMTNAENQQEPITVPNTFIPVEMTNMATVADLKRSTRFRDLINQGLLTLVSTEEAERMMTSVRFQEERKRLDDVRRGDVEKIRSGEEMRMMMDPDYVNTDRVASQAPAPIATNGFGLVNATVEAVAAGTMGISEAAVALGGLVKLLAADELVQFASKKLDQEILDVFEAEIDVRNGVEPKNG